MPQSLLYLSATDVSRALPMLDAIEAMREAFASLMRGDVILPTRLQLDATAENGTALIMPCHSAALKMFSLKIATVFQDNPKKSLPMVQSMMILTDAGTGTPVAIMDGARLTAIRTGAASGLATDLLARREASVAAIIGTGVQARAQLESVCSVRRIQHARVFGRNAAAATQFADAMSEHLGIIVESVATPAAALEDADIICTATNSRSPVFEDCDVKPGAHINAIGSFRADMIEIPSATVCRAYVVVDHFASAFEEAGDLIAPLQAGLVGKEWFKTELGQLVIEQNPRPRRPDEITLFKSVGVAIQDLYAAFKALERAREHGIGSMLTS